jgi:predicted Zn-dependent peptidase
MPLHPASTYAVLKSSPAKSNVQTVTLDNGARIITEVAENVYSASIGVWIEVGSEDETPENNGVSHCLEHMLFKGTKTRTAEQISQEIEDVGGTLGAGTGKENTSFYGQVLGEQLPVAIELLSDMLVNSLLRQEDLELEKQVILEEIKMYEDDPEDFAHETLIHNIWPDHPLSRPITGTNASVSRLTADILRTHVNDFYTPEHMIVSIAGNFNQDKAIDQLRGVLQRLKRGCACKNSEPPKIKPFRIIKNRDIEQAHISMAVDGLKTVDDRRFQLAVLDLCLGGNMSSRLFQEVREKRGLVYSINTYRECHRESGLFGVYAAASPKHVSAVLKLIKEEFERAKSEGFTEQEIERAKTQLKSDTLLGLESMRNRTARNAYSQLFYKRQLSIEELCEDINKVTRESVRAIAELLLNPERLSLVIVGPKSELKGVSS